MSNNQNKTLNKVKPYHLFTIAVLSASLAHSKVSAEESLQYDTATNLQQLQNEQTTLVENLEGTSSSIEGNINQEELNLSISNAEANGLEVESLPVEDMGVYTDSDAYQEAVEMIKNDYKNQANRLTKQLEEYKKLKEIYDIEKEQIEKENQKLQEDYQENLTRIKSTNLIRKKEYEEQFNLVTQLNQQIEEENRKIEKVNKQNYDAYVLSLEKAKKIVEQSNANPTVENLIHQTQDKYTDSMEWQNTSAKTIGDNIVVVAEGHVQNKEQLTDGSYTITAFSKNGESLPASSIISSVRWTDEIPYGETLVQTDKISEELMSRTGQAKVYDTSSGGMTQEWSVKAGQWVTFPKIVTLADGTKKDLRAKFEKTGSKLDFGQDWILLWNANGAINYLDGTSLVGHYPDDGIKVTYEIVNHNEPKRNYLWIMAALDIDGGQQLKLDKSGETSLLSIGGGLKVVSPTEIHADEDLGYTYGYGLNQNALDGVNSVPDGVVIYASYGHSIEHELKNSLGGHGSLVADADFGISVNTNIIPKYSPKSLKPPKKLPTVDYLPLTEEPTLRKLPDVPLMPKLVVQKKVIQYKPKIYKSVLNTEFLDIDQQHVAKGSEIVWNLRLPTTPDTLEKITSLEIQDTLPEGFKLNYSKTRQMNLDYNLNYTELDRKLNIQAKPQIIEKINSGQDIPSIKLFGDLLNDAGIYKNRYTARYGLEDGKQHSISNIVTVATPGRSHDKYFASDSKIVPLKHSFNESGQLSDNKTFLPGEQLNYELTWDLDQYKDDKSSKTAIAKGFAFVDDIPEDYFEILEDDIQIKDLSGRVVSTLKFEQFDSVQSLDDKTKNLLKEANINPKGRFMIWYPEDINDFYKSFVQKGRNLVFKIPVRMKSTTEYKIFENVAYQIDFGNGYQSNKVINSVQPLLVDKKVVLQNNEEKGDSTLDLNKYFFYQLDGALIYANQANPIKTYDFIDDYDETADEFNGTYNVLLDTDVKLRDGSVLVQGTDITKYTDIIHQDGMIKIQVAKDLLENLVETSQFKATAFIEMKRIKSGTIKNSFTNVVNGMEILSNEVISHTPAPKITKEAAPKNPHSNNKKSLPNTSDGGSYYLAKLSFILPLIISALSLEKWRKDGRSIKSYNDCR